MNENSGGASSNSLDLIGAAQDWYEVNCRALVASGYVVNFHVGQSEIHEIGLRVAIIDIGYRERVGRCLLWEVGTLDLEYTPLQEFSYIPDRETMDVNQVSDVAAALERLKEIVTAD